MGHFLGELGDLRHTAFIEDFVDPELSGFECGADEGDSEARDEVEGVHDGLASWVMESAAFMRWMASMTSFETDIPLDSA